MLELSFSHRARKFLKKTNPLLFERIDAKLVRLREEPFPSDAKHIGDHLYRVRVGDHRILYSIQHPLNLLIIEKIDKRERVY